MTKIAILGGSGYTAAELMKILLRHPRAEIVAVTSTQAGTPTVAELHPSLLGRIDLRCEPFDADRLVARGVTAAFGCLPHGVSMTTLPALLDRGVRVIDLSADYRLRDPNAYAQWYGESHGDLAHLAQAVYGLPELYGDEIADSRPGPARRRPAHRIDGHHCGQQVRREWGRADAEIGVPFSRVQRERVGVFRRHPSAYA